MATIRQVAAGNARCAAAATARYLEPVTGEITVFSGSCPSEFAEEMCQILGVELAPARTTRFSNDCLQVQLRANCRQRDVYIVQPLVPPVQEHLIELLLMLDAARGASAAQITVVIPHYAYARSDKKDAPRISIGGRLVADLLVTAGANRVLTMTLHAPQVHGFFSVPVDHLNALGVLAEHFRATTSATPSWSRPTSATPRWPPRLPGCSACRSPPAPSSGSPTTP